MRNPYIIGPYVTGRKYYGRQEVLEYLLHGASPAYWIVGTRRIGKTSLLRQLAQLAQAEDRLLPIWWDMQGCATFKHLGAYLADAVAECSEAFQPLGLTQAALANEDPLVLLPRLRRAARKAGREILLLCDESEALIKIARTAPRSMQRLHGELTAGNGMRVVIASTQAIYQLHDVCQGWPTSPFLAGFDMSQMLGSLSPAEARRLMLQAQEIQPVRAAPEVLDTIGEVTNHHPYLVQLLCARLFQGDGSLRQPTPDDLLIDPGLSGFLAVDFNLLVPADRRLILAIHEAQTIEEAGLRARLDVGAAELRQRVHNLERLGYLRRIQGQIALGNQFLGAWLQIEGAALAANPAPMSDIAMQAALTGQESQEARFLSTQLNAHRARLIELEAIRARDLLQVSPQVLAEIEQQQYHIRHLRRAAEDMEG